MFSQVPLEINYIIWDFCPAIEIVSYGFINKDCYMHILDPCSSVLFYRNSSRDGLSKIKIETKFSQIFNNTLSYRLRRRTIKENYGHNVDINRFYSLCSDNLEKFTHWLDFFEVRYPNEFNANIFITTKMVGYFDAGDGGDNYDYAPSHFNIFSSEYKTGYQPIFSPSLGDTLAIYDDIVYFNDGLVGKSTFFNTEVMYFNRSLAENEKTYSSNPNDTFPIYYDLGKDNSHLLKIDKNIHFWYIMDTSEYQVVGLTINCSGHTISMETNVTILKLFVIQKSTTYLVLKIGYKIDLSLIPSDSITLDTKNHPSYIRTVMDSSSSKLYIMVVFNNVRDGVGQHFKYFQKSYIAVFDLHAKKFMLDLIKIKQPQFDESITYNYTHTPKSSLAIIEDEYLLIINDYENMFFQWIDIRGGKLLKGSIVKYGTNLFVNVKVHSDGLLVKLESNIETIATAKGLSNVEYNYYFY